MAAVFFSERCEYTFTTAGAIRDLLADVVSELASPLRGDDEGPVLALIDRGGVKLAKAAKLLGFVVCALGTVEILAIRCLPADEETRPLPRARAARGRALAAYDTVASYRGHLAASGRLLVTRLTPGIAYPAVDDEQMAGLAAVKAALNAAMDLLKAAEALCNIHAPFADVSLLCAKSTPSATAAPKHIGAQGATISDDHSRVLGGWLNGAVQDLAFSPLVSGIEEARAALRLCADAIVEDHKVSSAAISWSGCYTAAFQALSTGQTELSALLARNSALGILYQRCAPEFGPDRVAMGWRLSDSWEAARADTERHGRAALDRLASAMSLLDYCCKGVLVWDSSSSSLQEAQEAMRRALIQAGAARDAGEKLRHAASRQFIHAACLFFEHAPFA